MNEAKNITIEFATPYKYACLEFQFEKACKNLIDRFKELNTESSAELFREIRHRREALTEAIPDYADVAHGPFEPFEQRYELDTENAVSKEFSELRIIVHDLFSFSVLPAYPRPDSSDSVGEGFSWPALERILRGTV